jgi:hypothetical protein
MLTNTEATAAQSPQTTATTIAIEDAERRCRATLRDIGRLTRTGAVSAIEAADLEMPLRQLIEGNRLDHDLGVDASSLALHGQRHEHEEDEAAERGA